MVKISGTFGTRIGNSYGLYFFSKGIYLATFAQAHHF